MMFLVTEVAGSNALGNIVFFGGSRGHKYPNPGLIGVFENVNGTMLLRLR
jgi:hypothetical protein